MLPVMCDRKIMHRHEQTSCLLVTINSRSNDTHEYGTHQHTRWASWGAISMMPRLIVFLYSYSFISEQVTILRVQYVAILLQYVLLVLAYYCITRCRNIPLSTSFECNAEICCRLVFKIATSRYCSALVKIKGRLCR